MRTSRGTVLTLAIAGLVTACGSSGPGSPATSAASPSPAAPASSPAAPASSPATAAGLAACGTGGLRVTVDNRQADAAAGSTYYPIDFTNISAAACRLNGYPGVSFVTSADAGGQQVGAAAARDPQSGPVAVRLDPGGAAHAWLQVGAAANYPASTCQPATAHGLRVYPPNQTEAAYIAQDFPACSAEGAQLLTVMPVRGGAGIAGSTP